MKWGALALAGFFLVIYFYGGPIYASCKCSQAGHSTLPYYFMGFVALAAYLPFYLYRHLVEDRRAGPEEEAEMAEAAAATGPGVAAEARL